MGRKTFLNLNDAEKKRLRFKRISQKSLEEKSIKDISEILDIPINRARAIALGESGLQMPLFTNHAFLSMQKQLDAALSPLKGISNFIANINGGLLPSNANSMAKLVESINQNAVLTGTTSKFFHDSILLSKKYEQLRINDWVTKISMTGLSHPDLARAVAQASSINSITQKLLGGISWNELGKNIGLDQRALNNAQSKFFEFSSGYQDVLENVAVDPTKYERFPLLAKIPTIEYHSHTTVLEVISSPKPVEPSMVDLANETDESVKEKLPLLHSGFPKMWLGAKAALHSDNPDRIRHFHASVRELLTRIIHMLAPDEDIKKWSTNENDFHNGRPTRKARFTYICRDINSGSFSSFLAKDLNAMVGLFDLFQEGTHGIEPDFTESQLSVIEFRVESYLRFLLEIEFKVNR